jgi:hypothetical protein
MQLRTDIVQALTDWKAGKAIRALELGHSNRMKEDAFTGAQVIDNSRFFNRDQSRAYAYFFKLMEYFSQAEVSLTPTHDQFSAVCDDLEKTQEGLTPEEIDGAKTLAWKVLLVGWRRAMDGFPESSYMEVKRSDT